MIFEVNVVAGEEPVDGGGGGGVVFRVLPETIDVFVGGDKVAKCVGFRLVGEGKLDDDAVN